MTTDHKSENKATRYKLEITVDELTFNNLDDVIADLREVIHRGMTDKLTPLPKRDRKEISDSPDYLRQIAKGKDEKETKRKDKAEDAKLRAAAVSPEVLNAIAEACKTPVADQYRNGNEKSLNSLVGIIMKQKLNVEPEVIKYLIIETIQFGD